MKIARYRAGTDIYYGVLEGDRLHRVAGAPYEGSKRTGQTDPLGSVQLLCPVENPRIFGVGLNYVAHSPRSARRRPSSRFCS